MKKVKKSDKRPKPLPVSSEGTTHNSDNCLAIILIIVALVIGSTVIYSTYPKSIPTPQVFSHKLKYEHGNCLVNRKYEFVKVLIGFDSPKEYWVVPLRSEDFRGTDGWRLVEDLDEQGHYKSLQEHSAVKIDASYTQVPCSSLPLPVGG